MFFFFYDNFPSRLKQLRQSSGLTLEQLGNNIGSTKSTLSNFENGNKNPSLEILINLADYFNVSIDYLAGRTDNPKINR